MSEQAQVPHSSAPSPLWRTPRKILWRVLRIAVAAATLGGADNFLGAPWVTHLLARCPSSKRWNLALLVLALSPHYFSSLSLRDEDARLRRSRHSLAQELIGPYLDKGSVVLDYGCGPGYLAQEVARTGATVTAVDISEGALDCARILNADGSITYTTPPRLDRRSEGHFDLAYSVAVVQHLSAPTLREVLRDMYGALRPDGQLLIQYAQPHEYGDFRTEAEWDAVSSFARYLRLRYVMKCFGRTAREMSEAAWATGFVEISIRCLAGTLTTDDDVAFGYVLIARRPS